MLCGIEIGLLEPSGRNGAGGGGRGGGVKWLHGRRTVKTPIPKGRLYWCFCLGRCIKCFNFVGSESGQKQSVKLLQNMVCNTTQHPPPHSNTLFVYTVRLL